MKKESNFEAFIISRFLVILILIIAVEWLVKVIADWILLQLLQKDIIDLSEAVFEDPEVIIPFLIIIVIFIVPILIAAVWFSRIVMEETARIKEHERTVRQLYEKKRNMLLSDIAHDLRTPITTIAGYSKALCDGMVQDEAKQKEYLRAIESKSQRMNELIHLLFEYVKLDSTYYCLEVKPENLSELLRKNAALLYSDMEDKGMKFRIDVPEEPCMVSLDDLQFSRAITNLITNAIKHNRPGTTIQLKMIQKEKEIKIVVCDNGEPIPGFLISRIFEPFAIGDASRREQDGSGLGLSIAKKIVEMHGWELYLNQNDIKKEKSFIIIIKQ
uniref:sensor histidine kinase n=1 Tax=Agathobacter sp. TaxID=2021311 RepID=UPI0040576FEE